jgi:hypothetical protein
LNVWLAAGWGVGGGLIVEFLELYRAVRRAGGLPWQVDPDHEPHPPALALAALIRMAIGGVIAAAMASGGEIGGGLGALAAGVAAPLIIDQLGQTGGSTKTGTQAAPPADPHTPTNTPVQPSPSGDAPLSAAGGSDG